MFVRMFAAGYGVVLAYEEIVFVLLHQQSLFQMFQKVVLVVLYDHNVWIRMYWIVE
jgi:hypothetical protein